MKAVAIAVWLCTLCTASNAVEWRIESVPTPGKVTAIETSDENVRVAVGGQWFRLSDDGKQLDPSEVMLRHPMPKSGLPDGRVATGRTTVAKAWYAEPTGRYPHGILGDPIEAGSLEIETRDGALRSLRLGQDAVFEDLTPRIAVLNGSERIIAVKSYLSRGSVLAIIDPASATIIAETPPIGHAFAWLNPAGVADFDDDGATDIALVRQPHVIGQLELWSWRGGHLTKRAEVSGVSNHFIGSRALDMGAVADFDGDGRPDLAVPSFDRRALRLIAFDRQADRTTPRDIARIALPAQISTNIGLIKFRGRPALLAGLETGKLILIRD